MAYKNDYGTGKSFTIGHEGEKTFMAHAQEMGWKPREASKHEDMHHHIDAWVEMYGVTMSVDIKGIKGGIEEGLITIELLNVQGNHGWLYGKADIIAFQVSSEQWIMVQRDDLKDLVERKMGITTPFNLDERKSCRSKFCHAPNWYRRLHRSDAITNLTIEEVRKIA